MNERLKSIADMSAQYAAVMSPATGRDSNELFIEKFSELLLEGNQDATVQQLANEQDREEREERQRLSQQQALRLIRLLASLESWSFSTRTTLPDYLQDDLSNEVEALAKIILGE